MAAGEPAAKHWATDMTSAYPPIDTTSLEIGMAGMSLVSKGSGRKETDSTIASTPPDDDGGQLEPPLPPPPHMEHSRGSAPASPISERKGVSRPPGLAGPAPSPIGKPGPGHSKNTSATSPLLTLTPNSSEGGISDWHSMGTRQSSPFHVADAPALPFLQSDQRRSVQGEDAQSYGSFEIASAENDNDGLLGLDALRDRAQSSPGPVPMISSSPPVARGHFPPHFTGQPPHEVISERARPVARDRPPLGHSYQDTASYHSNGGVPFPMTIHSRAGSDASNVSLDSAAFGTIGRPELRQTASDYEVMNRRRASSSDNYQQAYIVQHQNGYVDAAMASKFGSLPTMSNHLQHQRAPDGYAELQRPRHVRSVSQPMSSEAGHQVPVDARYYHHPSHDKVHSSYSENKYKTHTSMSHQALSSSYEGQQHIQKRVSMPNLGAGGQHIYATTQQSYLPRHELDFQVSPHSQGSVVASSEEIRAFGAPSMISPGHSPMQVHYGGSHSRHPSDGGSAILSSSPISVGSGIPRGPPSSFHHRQVSGGSGGMDDDLQHPLVGESIDVPDVHDHQSRYAISQSLPQMIPRNNSGHGHSLSLDQMPPQFIEAPHNLPTAGAALPMPKIVYSVKFKRTQRNFVLGPRIVRDLKIGTYVKVEADRGEDLGIVVGKVAADKYNFSGRSAFSAGLGGAPGMSGAADLKRIIRLATHDEVSLLSIKREEEDELLKICRGKVRQRGLPMNVVDAEYQFDRHKLTFFFEAEGRVDFRELVRDLFSMYKTRIWMQQLDKSTSTSAPAIVAPHPNSLQMDYGTPIIAPLSEFSDSIVLGSLPPSGDARSH